MMPVVRKRREVVGDEQGIAADLVHEADGEGADEVDDEGPVGELFPEPVGGEHGGQIPEHGSDRSAESDQHHTLEQDLFSSPMDGCALILLRRRRRGRAALGPRLPAEVVREEPRLAVKGFDRPQIGAGLGLGERLAVSVVVLSHEAREVASQLGPLRQRPGQEPAPAASPAASSRAPSACGTHRPSDAS